VAAGLIALLTGGAPSLGALVGRLIRQGMARRQAARIGKSLSPFAASVGRDGAPDPATGPAALPAGDAPSGMER